MSLPKLLFNLFCAFELILNSSSTSTCLIHDDEILCNSFDFYHYNYSSITNNILTSSQTLHLTHTYYSGILPENIHKLIIDDYPYDTFLSPFSSSLTLHSLFIEHTSLNLFPIWLCTSNRNLSSIEINYSHIEQILSHDLNLCLNLRLLRIANSYLKQFTNLDHIQVSLQFLYLNHNNLTDISNDNGLNLNQFPSLRRLDLSYNQLKSISSDYFNQTLALTTLDLSYSHLEVLQLNSNKYLISLEILDLRGNNHLQINEKWYHYFPYLTKIYFPHTHFCCHLKNEMKTVNDKHIQKSIDEQTRKEFNDGKENQLYPISFHSEPICFPLPDPMTPCESLFSSKIIRFIFHMIVFISVISNFTALIITVSRLITSSHNRWSSSTLFSSNLALADFISSIYLILVGIIDLRFDENFYIKTQIWTKSYLCTLAGFIYIFGIQSSMYALTLLTFERFYTILFSFKRQTPWPARFTLTIISLGWCASLIIASLPLINMNDFHSNSLCVPLRMETLFDRLYLSLLIIIDLCFIGLIITCNSLICFNFSKSHVHTLNDARATLKILTLVIAVCISRLPLIIFIFMALIIHPNDSHPINNYGFRLDKIKLAILFLQPLSSCLNPFMYSSLLTLNWASTTTTTTTSGFERGKPIRKSFEFSRFRSKSTGFNRGYYPLRMMSITSLEYRSSSLPETP